MAIDRIAVLLPPVTIYNQDQSRWFVRIFILCGISLLDDDFFKIKRDNVQKNAEKKQVEFPEKMEFKLFVLP